ncbi:MAG TPA: family 16 glycosylhydrolase [Polyangia bacterium]
MNSRSALLPFVIATALIPASAMGMASAELYRTQAYFYGRFDARIQFAPGDGVVSAFFLWKEGSDAANAYWNELDYEKIAADCHMQTNSIYGKPKSYHKQTPALSSICTAYHDYRFEWTPTYIAWVVDGKEIRRDTGADATAYAQNASGGMTFHFNIWPGNADFGGNINNTTLPVHQYISWVEYSSYDNGNFNVQWREEFQSSGVPSGWAVGNWASPYNLSTHNTQNVGFVNGIAVLSLTADNATGNPGTPPVDTSAGGASGSGGSGASGGIGGLGGSTGQGGAASSSGGANGMGGTMSSGGATGAGGTPTASGTTGSGSAAKTGGTIASGGNIGAGGTMSAGGTTGLGSTTPSGGNIGLGGTTAPGGEMGAGGATRIAGTTSLGGTPSGGTTGAGGTNSTGGAPYGGSAGTTDAQGGCSCNTAYAASPIRAALVVLVLCLIVSRPRRRKI